MYRKIILFLFLCFCISDFAFAQETLVAVDSSKLYRDIESFSKKRKSTNFIYRIFFNPVAVSPALQTKTKKKKNLQKPCSAFEGKIIRGIHITTLDPFGYTAADTAVATQNTLSKAGNKLHIKSQSITIRNLLLIHKNEPLDSLLVKESERLIRTQKYVNEVFFYVVSAGADSVDIFIRGMDKWSIIPKGAISTSSYTIDLTDKNFLGFGHEFQNVFTRNYTAGNYSFNTNYSIPNIRNTYISTALHYGIDANKNISRSLAVDRPFFSPFAKWAAGFFVSQQFQNNSVHGSDSVLVTQNIKYNVWDYWARNAQQIFNGNTEDERTTNLILTGRFFRIRYLDKPLEIYDSL